MKSSVWVDRGRAVGTSGLTRDVWAGHGGTADGVGSPVTGVPGGGDVHAGGEDVHAAAVVGEGGTGVTAVSGADGDGLRGKDTRNHPDEERKPLGMHRHWRGEGS